MYVYEIWKYDYYMCFNPIPGRLKESKNGQGGNLTPFSFIRFVSIVVDVYWKFIYEENSKEKSPQKNLHNLS